MNDLLSKYLENKPNSFFWYSGLIVVVLIGISEYLLGYGVSISIFYLVPISLATWYAGKGTGTIFSFISAGMWFAADELSATPFTKTAVPIWNAAVRLCFFLIFVFLLDGFKREKARAREDHLTGLGNRRKFFELAEAEIKRSLRYGHPFTLAYIDVDDFKSVNDTYGHDVGDTLLKTIGGIIKQNVRTTDIDARLGGDEFAVLLPETGSERAVRFFNKLHQRLSETVVRDRSITFSVGVITFVKPPESIDKMIRIADQLMYSVKESGKSLVKFNVIDEEQSLKQ